MKRDIYSYSKLWMILFVLMGTACTNQVEDAIPESGQPIEFSVQSDWKEIPNTRLVDDNGTMKFTKGDEIRIFCFYNEKKTFMYDVDDPTRGQIVVLDDDGKTWNYSPKRFWPKEGKLLFLASYPQNSIHNYGVNTPMIYDQTDNPLRRDLLWGVSGKDCAKNEDRKNNVEFTMVHALAKVNISLDESLGDHIGSVVVSAYKTGWFSEAKNGGIPDWHVDDKTDIISTTFYKWTDKDKDKIKNNSVTVFILPETITRIQMFADFKPYDKIYDTDPSNKIQQYTFKAGKEYNLKISSKGVQKKNTNSRSIAMSVRCVSEQRKNIDLYG